MQPFRIGSETIAPGERRTVDLPVSVLSNHAPVTLPVRVVHGRRLGPVLFVSAAVHGDEIVGVEIIRRVLRTSAIRQLKGTLLCVPVVNAFGFISHTRYLPDRRDLNRCFPGSAGGSLAAQLAYLFMNEVVARSDFGIDLHSAAVHRINLPQIRVSPRNDETRTIARIFGAPLIMEAPLRDGSLRKAAQDRGVDMLLYEAGEALRFDELPIRVGVKGILRVMKHMGMIGGRRVSDVGIEPAVATSSYWVRSPAGGILRAFRTIGDGVREGDLLGYASDPLGEKDVPVVARSDGLIIGRTNLPVVNQGDALFHIANLRRAAAAERKVGQVERELVTDPLFDEDEII